MNIKYLKFTWFKEVKVVKNLEFYQYLPSANFQNRRQRRQGQGRLLVEQDRREKIVDFDWLGVT